MLGPRDGRVPTLGREQSAPDEMPGRQVDRVTGAPLRLLFLAAVAEGAAGERPVLMEVAIGVGLDQSGTGAGTHVRPGLAHGEVDRQWIHSIDPPATDAEARPTCGEPGLAGGLGDVRGDRVLVVLDEETER